MTDRGSFRVQSEALRSHAGFWSTKAGQAESARSRIEPAVGRGDALGYLAGQNGVADNYNTWTNDMYAALDDAAGTFHYLHAALISTANDYDGTDATVATSMPDLDRMNNVR